MPNDRRICLPSDPRGGLVVFFLEANITTADLERHGEVGKKGRFESPSWRPGAETTEAEYAKDGRLISWTDGRQIEPRVKVRRHLHRVSQPQKPIVAKFLTDHKESSMVLRAGGHCFPDKVRAPYL